MNISFWFILRTFLFVNYNKQHETSSWYITQCTFHELNQNCFINFFSDQRHHQQTILKNYLVPKTKIFTHQQNDWTQRLNDCQSYLQQMLMVTLLPLSQTDNSSHSPSLKQTIAVTPPFSNRQQQSLPFLKQTIAITPPFSNR